MKFLFSTVVVISMLISSTAYSKGLCLRWFGPDLETPLSPPVVWDDQMHFSNVTRELMLKPVSLRSDPFNDEAVYSFVNKYKNYSRQLLHKTYDAAIGEEQVEKWIALFGADYWTLLFDPSMAAYAGDLAQFIRKNKDKYNLNKMNFLTLTQLRRDFIASKGKVRVYRAMYLSHSMVETVKRRGLLPRAQSLFDSYSYENNRHHMLLSLFPKPDTVQSHYGIINELKVKLSDEASHLMSVTFDPKFGERTVFEDPNIDHTQYHLYLIEIETPRVFVLNFMKDDKNSLFHHLHKVVTIPHQDQWVQQGVAIRKYSALHESWILGAISPSEIKKIERIRQVPGPAHFF